MMLADVIQAGGTVCQQCQGHDHETGECALSSRTNFKRDHKHSYPSTPYSKQDDDYTCRRFNRAGGCPSLKCRFEHKCSNCGKSDHGASSCRSAKTLPKPKTDATHSTPGPS
jgi:hypothetical protein